MLEVLVEEEPVGDADLAEGLGPADLGADAGALPTLPWVPDPVVPVRPGPLHLQFIPQLPVIEWRVKIGPHTK